MKKYLSFSMFVAASISLGACGGGGRAAVDGGTRDTGSQADTGSVGTCGDLTCDPGETIESCFSDCSPGSCGNGICEATSDETPATCPVDCETTPTCGNGTCDTGEDTASCAADCPAADECDTTSDSCDSCQECAQTGACASNVDACVSDGECAALVTCLQACADEPCIQACASDHAAGVRLYQEAVLCLCGTCDSTCADTCM